MTPVKIKDQHLIPKNARTFTIGGDVNSITSTKVGDNIIQLALNTYTISIGDVIPVKGHPYKVNQIKEFYINGRVIYEVSSGSLSKTAMFVFPMLSGNRKLFLFDKLFVNAYIRTEKEKNCIALLYRFSGSTLFLKFEQALRKFRNFIRVEDPSPHFVLFVFSIPEDYYEEYARFLKGKYSKFNNSYKMKILEFHGFSLEGQMAQILFQGDKLRKKMETSLGCSIPKDSELHSIVNLEEETFNINKYIRNE
jgi:hypothetical protein|tara:strand:+ start:1201 stop:1953 length:753 start_codon:yes stop_codon:yes gene_type:complete